MMLKKIREYLGLYASNENVGIFDGFSLREMIFLLSLIIYYHHSDKSVKKVARYIVSRFNDKMKVRELCIHKDDEVVAEKLIEVIEKEIVFKKAQELYIEKLSLDIYKNHCYYK